MKASLALFFGLACAVPAAARGQSGVTAPVAAFRTGLTATIAHRESTDRCTTITLRWVLFPTAASYVVQVSDEPDRGWRDLALDSACATGGASPGSLPNTLTLRIKSTAQRRF